MEEIYKQKCGFILLFSINSISYLLWMRLEIPRSYLNFKQHKIGQKNSSSQRFD